MIQTLVQFGGFPNDDPNAHIVNFLEIWILSSIIG